MTNVSQTATLIFVGLLILATVLEYNAVVYDAGLTRVIGEIEAGLGFFFVAFVILFGANSKGKEMQMLKGFTVGLSLVSWFLVWTKDTTGDPTAYTAWQRVTKNVAMPIFQGSLFALPIVALGGY